MPAPAPRSWQPWAYCVLALLSVKLLLQLPFLGNYGFHRDELYYLSAAARPALGYADFAPMTAWVVALVRDLVGTGSPWMLRVPVLLLGCVALVLMVLWTRWLGGRVFAAILAGMALLLAPVWLRTSGVVSAPSLEPLPWLLTCWAFAAALRDREVHRPWVWFAVSIGLGLWIKHTILVLGFAVALALVCCRRVELTRPRLWLAFLLAVGIWSPHLWWQVAEGWPTLEFIADLRESTIAKISPGEFLVGQVLYIGPGAAILVLVGWFTALRRAEFRGLAIVWVAVLGTFLVLGSKIYYAVPVHLPLIGVGASAIQGMGRMVRAGAVLAVVVPGAVLAPLSVPMLPIEEVDDYAARVTMGLVENAHEVTGDLHDMLGWKEHVEALAAVYHDLPEDEQAECILFGQVYGQAGALEWFGPELGLPSRVFSNQMSWHHWGVPVGAEFAPVALGLGWSPEPLERFYEDVRLVRRSTASDQALARVMGVFVARGLRDDLRLLWPDQMGL